MRDLMAAVGQVLLSWGYLEAAIRDRIMAINPELKSSMTPLRSLWHAVEPSTPEFEALYAEIASLADTRHCLAHGLSSANADPAAGKEPEVVCRTLTGDRAFTFSTLQGVAASLHRAAWSVRGSSPARLKTIRGL
jgi:hypothetical protein